MASASAGVKGPDGRTLRAVAHNVYSQPAAHPVETIQDNWLANQLETKHYIMAQAHGAHLPMQIRMELETVCQSRRLPGMPTSNLGAECILGRDETIEFEDFMNMPNNSETGVDMRAALEHKYGLRPRNAMESRVGGGPAMSMEPPRSIAQARPLGL